MGIARKRKIIIYILLGIMGIIVISLGMGLGMVLSFSRNFQNAVELDASESALPTQIYDINENLITEFFSNEKRSLISLEEVPDHLIYAILTREDRNFYEHSGFDLKGIIRSGFSLIFLRKFIGGASTITQQVAGNRYADRRDISTKRKLVELWWAFQLERRYTKDEILEFYLNEIPFGHGTNGVEAASQFYFKHSVKDITVAESVLLVNVVASHTKYSPILNPDNARERQIDVLNQMVELGYVTRDDADKSFREYWKNYDYTRQGEGGAWSTREDRAPWFSWYVQEQLSEMFLGSEDVFKGGLKVYTTLNLDFQQYADELMTREHESINNRYKESTKTRSKVAEAKFVPIIDLLSFGFNIRDIQRAGNQQKIKAKKYYHEKLNPLIDLVSSGFNINSVKEASYISFEAREERLRKTEVEGAMVAIDSKTGHIVTMIGGGKGYSSKTNALNRAVYAHVQPGSAFKPLYYAEAIRSRKFTAASMILDAPVVFINDDGTDYVPLNYKGRWSPNGRVLLRTALAKSLNIPSLKILEGIGFNAAIKTSSTLLGITDPVEIEKNFPRKYPLGLGVVPVSPIQMVQAYASFANQGKQVTPIAIRYIEDRKGNIIYEPEKELREKQKKLGKKIYLLAPEEAFLMAEIMKGALKSGGTLWSSSYRVGHFDRPIAGKTGTTQNWSDAWAVGYTPNYTTAVWFGFDTPGMSLGTDLSGAAAAGPVWAYYMKHIHAGLPPEDFYKPNRGVIEVEVCELSGKLPDPKGFCGEDTYKEWFLTGTEPVQYCEIHRKESDQLNKTLNVMGDTLILGLDVDIDLSFLDDGTSGSSNSSFSYGDNGNSLMDDDTDSLLNDILGNNLSPTEAPGSDPLDFDLSQEDNPLFD